MAMSRDGVRCGSAVVTVVVILVLFSSGCSPKSGVNTLPVSGTVKLDGVALDQGVIQFEPQPPGGKAVNAATPIKDGKYQFPAGAGGLLPGTYRVLVSSVSSAPALPSDPIKAMEQASQPPPPDRIPRKFNVESTLQAVVKADGPNNFDFDLSSKN
jgi:hypothetical protein